jgi:transcriptional regulator
VKHECENVLLRRLRTTDRRGYAECQDRKNPHSTEDTGGRRTRHRLGAGLVERFGGSRCLPSGHLKETAVAEDHLELLQGTLEMLVLKTLALEPMHGWGIAHRIQWMSKDVFLVTQGSLYPALVRMRRYGWVKTSWRTTENGRRARYYELTAAGKKQLAEQHSVWERASMAVNQIMLTRDFVPEGGAA